MCQLLLVDDEPVLLNSMVDNDWESAGIARVHKAASGLEAAELLKHAPIDIIVTDIRMPGMNGLELCKHVQEHYPRTKCILLSGYGEFEYARQAILHGTVSYLLKPIKDEELLEEVGRIRQQLEQEWKQSLTSEQARHSLRSHLPLLRANLLNALLAGDGLAALDLPRKLAEYQLPFVPEAPCLLMLIRPEGGFGNSEEDSLLYEFAVHNIACEILSGRYTVWYGKDPFGYMCFLLQNKEKSDLRGNEPIPEKAAQLLQGKVAAHLKGQLSVIVSGWSGFPGELAGQYRKALNEFRKLPHSDRGGILHSGAARTQSRSLDCLYSPPSFQQLMEARRWEDARSKLDQVFERMNADRLDTEEHIMEVGYTLMNAFLYYAHMRGHTLLELSGQQLDLTGDPRLFMRSARVREWAEKLLASLEASDGGLEQRDGKSQLISRIHRFIETRIAGDVSLQTIADHVNLHPVYLSSMYKQERQENISDFIMRYRMEKAGVLLHTTDIKIYELASQLGFQNPPYFSKLFKQYYGVTPQEYRDRQTP
ncbi:MAG: hypothetical protein K0R57_634 [Paenibacillaceae bacterium]|jgi:two-component system response regulator YesN|nr:hypothetical protein [Paenibacillaceae bacterium]